MMRSNLPNRILGVVFAAVLIFCGCSGFTSDPPVAGTTDDSDVNLQKEFAMARTYAQGSYEVKESSENTKTGVISISLVQESGCVKQGETYQWVDDLNRVTQFAGGLFRYSFAGDTLTLTALNEEPDYYGNVTVLKFVGGEPGKLQGIWLQLSRSAYTVYWNFGEGSIEIRVLEKENFNYMQSLFMWMFYESLEDSSMDIYADLIYDEHAADPSRYGVTILEQDNRSETFTYKNVTYEIKIDSVHSFDDYLSMTFSSGTEKCHLEYFSTLNVTSEMCKAENADGLHYSDATPDVMTRYSWGNEKEFSQCMYQLVQNSKPAEVSVSAYESAFKNAHDVVYAPIRIPEEYEGAASGLIYSRKREEGRCVTDGDGVKWNENWYTNYYVDNRVDPDTMKIASFSLRGDTLLYSDHEGVEEIWIRDTPGGLYGYWKASASYVNGELQYWPATTLYYMLITKDSLYVAYDVNPEYDFTDSRLFEELHNCFVNGSDYIYLQHIFDEAETVGKDGVTILSKTKTSEVVSVNGKNYEIILNHAHALWQDVSVTVKSDGMTCSGRYVQIEQLTPEMCCAENAEFLVDYDGGAGTIAYVIDEEQDFKRCLSQMVKN